MDQKPHSFAYCYAKQILRKKTPKYAPLLSLVCGLALLAMAFRQGSFEFEHFVVPILMLCVAIHTWLERGKQEAFQEAETIIEELRSSKND